MTVPLLAWAAGALLLVAGLAGWGERRRQRRDDPDRVGLVSWPAVQMAALLALLLAVSLLLHA